MSNNLKSDNLTYRNPSLTIDERVDDLLARMTTREKARQMDMHHGSAFIHDKDPVTEKCTLTSTVLPGSLEEIVGEDGIGCIHDLYPRNSAISNDIQKYCREKTRLGIPVLISEEALHGLCSEGNTVFPQMLALASTFSRDLAKRVGAAIAAEMRSKGIHLTFSPVLEIARDPRWGRTEETFGEDTFLAGEMGLGIVKGLQGKSLALDTSVVAEPKHFAVHSLSRGGLNCAPVSVGEREMRRDYFPVFKKAVIEGGAMSVMCAYHSIDGIPCASDEWLLKKVLRDEWGFRGFVCSDLGAIRRLCEVHMTAQSPEDALRQAVEAGMDMQFYDFDHQFFQEKIVEMVQGGLLKTEDIDRAVGGILRVKFELGLFDNPYVDVTLSSRKSRCREHLDLALEAARECICLLKNENAVLPVDCAKIRKIALIGPNAFHTQTGDYSADMSENPVSTLFDELSVMLPGHVRLLGEKGVDVFEGEYEQISRAAEIASECDMAIVVCGESSKISGEGRDRVSLFLPGRQQELVKAVCETGTPVVLVLSNGRPLVLEWEREHVQGIIEAWYPGEMAARAIAEVLLGICNPSGKLPISFPKSTGQIPVHYNRLKGEQTDYADGDSTPAFCFGDGFGYSEFLYSGLSVLQDGEGAQGKFRISLQVKNTGRTAGRETVQLYLHDEVSSTVKACRDLKGFEKIHLEPGEEKTVVFVLGTDALATLGKNMKWEVEPGKCKVFAGSNLHDLLECEFIVKGP
jgi:beta-glucosidase